jgi:transcriptional regulator with XRE-family HTH domain
MYIPLRLQQPYELLETLSKRFKERRLIKKISQKDLAKKSGVGISIIRKLEQNGNIQLLDLIKLLDAINEIEEIHNLMNFSAKIKNERELDLLMNLNKTKTMRIRSKKGNL